MKENEKQARRLPRSVGIPNQPMRNVPPSIDVPPLSKEEQERLAHYRATLSTEINDFVRLSIDDALSRAVINPGGPQYLD